MNSTTGYGNPWLETSPAEWMQRWWSLLSLAPQLLVQPILPGWTFAPVLNVTTTNSGDPDAEAEILRTHSYGRQLGTLLDAVADLIEKQPDEERPESFEKLLELQDHVTNLLAERGHRRATR